MYQMKINDKITHNLSSKVMNDFLRNLIYLFTLFGIGNLYAFEYKTLISKNSGGVSEIITLQNGEIAEVLHLSFRVKDKTTSSSPTQIVGYLEIDKNGTVIQFPKDFYEFGGYSYPGAARFPVNSESAKGLIITGPATIQCKGHNCLASLKITTTSELSSSSQSSQKYATVIPENSKTDVNVILEQSTDLVNWSTVSPGQFSSSASKRFFRVRSANVPVSITGATNASPIVITSTGHLLNTEIR